MKKFFTEGGIPETVVDIDNYHFNPFAFDDFVKAKYTIYMFTDLFGLHRFDQQSLVRFTLTIKKNYRRVPYHNWTHGFSVANTMYTVIKRSEDAFRPIEVETFFVLVLINKTAVAHKSILNGIYLKFYYRSV